MRLRRLLPAAFCLLPALAQADVGIARFVHYTELAGFTIAPQVLLPAVSVEVGGKGSTVSTDGISDPILGLPVWLVNRPEQRLYFAVTPYLHLPLGRYNSNRALNPGENRWKFTLQGGLSVGLGEKTTLDVIGDAQWFGNNRSIAGGGHLEQNVLYSLQPQLTYQLAPGLTSSLGVYHVWGGATQVRGVDQHDRTRTTTALVGTLAGLVITAALGWWATDWAHLTGVSSEDDHLLAATAPDLQLRSLVLCGIIVAGRLVMWLGSNWPDLVVGLAPALIAIKGRIAAREIREELEWIASKHPTLLDEWRRYNP